MVTVRWGGVESDTPEHGVCFTPRNQRLSEGMRSTGCHSDYY